MTIDMATIPEFYLCIVVVACFAALLLIVNKVKRPKEE